MGIKPVCFQNSYQATNTPETDNSASIVHHTQLSNLSVLHLCKWWTRTMTRHLTFPQFCILFIYLFICVHNNNGKWQYEAKIGINRYINKVSTHLLVYVTKRLWNIKQKKETSDTCTSNKEQISWEQGILSVEWHSIKNVDDMSSRVSRRVVHCNVNTPEWQLSTINNWTRQQSQYHRSHQSLTSNDNNNNNNNNNNIHLMALCPGLFEWAGTRKVKPIWILLKQETASGSGISRAICKSAPCRRKITIPASHHSVIYSPDVLLAAQPTASKHWRQQLQTLPLARTYIICKSLQVAKVHNWSAINQWILKFAYHTMPAS